MITAHLPVDRHLHLRLLSSLQKASSGAEATRHMTARAGRASYIAADRVTLPDPGAVAVAAILGAVVETLKEK